MKKKEGIFVIVFLILLVLAIGGFLIYRNWDKKQKGQITEYTPQEEISEEQIRQTIITLYYKNKDTNELVPEARKIDVNKLAKNPYEYLINCLLETPKNEKLQNVLPTGTRLNKVELKGRIVYVDFSKEFIENAPNGKEEQEKMVDSLVRTLVELNEVDGVKIVIDGEENKEFKDSAVNFKKEFFIKN